VHQTKFIKRYHPAFLSVWWYSWLRNDKIKWTLGDIQSIFLVMTPHLDPTKKSTQRLSKSTWLPPLFIPHPGAHNHARAINSIINYQIMLLNPRLSLIKAKNIGSDTAHRLHFSRVCLLFWKGIFLKLFFKYFWIYLLLKNINQQKILLDHFLIKEKFNLVFIKIFFFYFE
jgi:hypothetical protein